MKATDLQPPSLGRFLGAMTVIFVSLTPSILCLLALHYDLVPFGVEAMLGFVVVYAVSTAVLIAFLMRRYQRRAAPVEDQFISQEEEASQATSGPPRYGDVVIQISPDRITPPIQQNEDLLRLTAKPDETEPPIPTPKL
ncbi:uncharacterized protein [Palaemon carinicauda]|uniref:uncharacterized protein isoform X1 n=1 Tax=Palaemon carinicauda TaxID=392227 RepID=UPI0035B5EC69